MNHGSKRGRSIFIGPNGLRAGWGCLLFILLILLYQLFFSALAQRIAHGHARPALLPPSIMIPVEFFSAAGVVFATWLMARAEGRSFRAYGLRDRASLRRFGGGLLVGFGAICILVGTLRALHLLALAPAGLGGAMGCCGAWAFCSRGCSRSCSCAATYYGPWRAGSGFGGARRCLPSPSGRSTGATREKRR